MKQPTTFGALVLLWCGGPADARVALPRILSDHMVLQQGVPVRVWGTADPGEAVTVRFAGQNVSTRANRQGKWQAFLAPLRAGGPSVLTVAGQNTIVLQDVVVGEVWVGSGQSNMDWPVERSKNAEMEIAAANFPQVRLFKVARKRADEPMEDVEGEWRVSSPETVADFSAVAYFFGRHLHEKLGVPVGLIQSSWGGSTAEAWTSRAALDSDPRLRFFFQRWEEMMAEYPEAKPKYERALKEWERTGKSGRRPQAPLGPDHHHKPGGLFNGMIAPLTPYAIRGVIWYQGEANAHRGQGWIYAPLFQALISDWRRHWGKGEFPFLFVQLANFARAPEGSQWPEVREAQALGLRLRNTGMAVTIDIGEPQDIHPTNKQDVGKRLALAARAIAYGERIVYSGPMFREVSKHGSELRMWFDHAGGALRTKGDVQVKGFTIAGADRRFVPAEARIDGMTVVVSASAVPDPVAVRYAWGGSPENNLTNADGLPASPFRSDQWADGRMP